MAEGKEGRGGRPSRCRSCDGGEGCGLAAGEMGTDAEVETRQRAWAWGGCCGHPGLWVLQMQFWAPLGSPGPWA